METLTNIVRLRQPTEIDDPLTEVLRAGARQLLAQAVEIEAEAFLAAMQDLRLPDGRARLVRHGHGPERAIQTGIGPVSVSRARVRDRGATKPEERVRFTSTILPKWARRTRSLDALLPVLYLRGVSTGDFQEALAALLGKDAPNLSPAVVTRLTATWADEYAVSDVANPPSDARPERGRSRLLEPSSYVGVSAYAYVGGTSAVRGVHG